MQFHMYRRRQTLALHARSLELVLARAMAMEIARTSGGLYSVWRLLRSPGTRSPACRLCMPVLQLTTRSSRTLCRRAPSDGHDTSTAQQARSKAQGAGAQAAAARPHSGRAKHPPGGGWKHPPACVRAPPLQHTVTPGASVHRWTHPNHSAHHQGRKQARVATGTQRSGLLPLDMSKPRVCSRVTVTTRADDQHEKTKHNR